MTLSQIVVHFLKYQARNFQYVRGRHLEDIGIRMVDADHLVELRIFSKRFGAAGPEYRLRQEHWMTGGIGWHE